MAFTPAALNDSASHRASEIDQLSVHSADPGTTGASQVAIASASYGAASGGTADLASSVALAMSSGDSVSHYGVWASGVFRGGAALTDPKSFSNDGTLTVTSAPITAS